MRSKATPAEVEILSIVSELVHDGFIEMDTDDIIALDQRQYKRIADLFCVWALKLLHRRMDERAEVDGEAAASIEAAARMAGDPDWTTTETYTIGECPP
jgi:hypothetical protein